MAADFSDKNPAIPESFAGNYRGGKAMSARTAGDMVPARVRTKTAGGKPMTPHVRTMSAKPQRKKMNFMVFVVLTIIVTFICCITIALVLAYFDDLRTIRDDYTSLQEIADISRVSEEMPLFIHIPQSPVPLAETPAPYVSSFDLEMREINPDYMCWIRVDDTRIDYPVVRGDDNEKYLEWSFYGERNYFG